MERARWGYVEVVPFEACLQRDVTVEHEIVVFAVHRRDRRMMRDRLSDPTKAVPLQLKCFAEYRVEWFHVSADRGAVGGNQKQGDVRSSQGRIFCGICLNK